MIWNEGHLIFSLIKIILIKKKKYFERYELFKFLGIFIDFSRIF